MTADQLRTTLTTLITLGTVRHDLAEGDIKAIRRAAKVVRDELNNSREDAS